MEGGSLQELAEYAENKGVKLWIWYNSGGPHTKVMNAGPRDLVYNKEIRRAEFKRISDMGIVGIKVDFFQSDKQQIIKLYHDIIKDAADFNIMVNTHGCTLPRGWFRTYPNLMTMEAVRGAELYGYPPFATEAVRLNTIYPFTRNVMGSMDYTPVTFSDYMEESAHRTTNAHELALSVIFESGVQHFADRYESYEAQPDFVVDFLNNVPVTWDDTYFVDGFPGKEVVMARKKQDTYFLAGINGEFKEKTLTFDLDFLPEGQFEMTLIKEGDTPRSFNTETMSIAGKDSFSIDIMPAGGFVAVIK
jgi:hypothetical protein